MRLALAEIGSGVGAEYPFQPEEPSRPPLRLPSRYALMENALVAKGSAKSLLKKELVEKGPATAPSRSRLRTRSLIRPRLPSRARQQAVLRRRRCSVFGSALMRNCRLSTSGTPACSSSRCSPSTSCGSAGRPVHAASGWRCPSRPGLCSPTSSPSARAATLRC